MPLQCIYNFFLFYNFTISISVKNSKLVNLNKLNDLVLKLSENVTEINYYEIIIFLQKNKCDTNNLKIDEIIKESNEEKKLKLIKELKIDDTVDFSSSGYIA